MKTRIILLLLVCFSCTAFAQKINTGINTGVTIRGQITLDGHWKGGDFGDDKGNRSLPFSSVIASIEDAIITVDFLEPANNVTITISSESQMVYSNSLLVSRPTNYSIPVGAFASGVYQLDLSNSNGGYVYGWFELK